jgi:hypothetical protein
MKCIATLANRMFKSDKRTGRGSWELVGHLSETNVIMFYLLSSLKAHAEPRSKTALGSLPCSTPLLVSKNKISPYKMPKFNYTAIGRD